jgi:hypothetical protein
MTRNLNAETIKKLTPLIQKIDDTLAKPQDERVDFTVQAMSPGTNPPGLERKVPDVAQEKRGSLAVQIPSAFLSQLQDSHEG